jgi:DNA gyrase inhibitor GyrI/catechol 2,3-dioxygenase-like lactoylglutathione lyase family enzyme
MKFRGGLLVVTDLERSKAFYRKYLNQDVIIDYGANVTLTGGFSLQTLSSWLSFIGGLDVRFRGNDTELYFETDDYDEFLSNIGELELVRPPIEQPWGQRCVRFYDPDGHIIEVGEPVTAAATRFKKSGMNVSQIAERMDVKEEYVREWFGYSEHKEVGVKRENLQDVRIAYMRNVGEYGSNNHELMETFKAFLSENYLFDEDTVILGIALDNPSQIPAKECRYDVGLVLSGKMIKGLETRRIDDGDYAVFEVKHTTEDVQRFWNDLPGLIEKLAVDFEKPIIERYAMKKIKNHLCEFLLPLK